MPPGGGIHTIKIRARLAQDLVGLPKLAGLAFQSLQLCRHIRGNTGAHTTVALGLLHPLMQRLRRAADLGGDRRDRRPARGMLAFVIQNHSHRAGADLGRELVGRLACHGLPPSQELEPPINPERFSRHLVGHQTTDLQNKPIHID
jgi:hypothetical protein